MNLWTPPSLLQAQSTHLTPQVWCGCPIGTRQRSPNWGPASPSGPLVTSPSVPNVAELPPGQAAAGGGCGPGGLSAAQRLPPLPWDKQDRSADRSPGGRREAAAQLQHGCASRPPHPQPCLVPTSAPIPKSQPLLPVASPAASRSFLLYNRAHNMCVEARGQQLSAAPCLPEAAAQRFQWLPGMRLWNAERRRCVTAAAELNLSVVTLQPCREDGRLQRWECGEGGLLALAGRRLYFNYGNNVQQTVMLYVGDREWSRWVVHGSDEELCTRSCQSRLGGFAWGLGVCFSLS
ncbi:macrophage mannose receptor 1-like isoform X1 [Phasianus colchicus]|uniref:macrophage mannose receptor 1-like isoform X1 n=1 Tax=Phasianus colchicus TaxID=9054 RepID=UPI00129E95FD|nr:macrophage mannose receptor 1-like isoform X1 [Phasianus colchicus]